MSMLFVTSVVPSRTRPAEVSKPMVQDFSRLSKAIVFPAGTVAGYGLISSLGIANVPVVGISPRKCDNLRSRYLCESYIVPDPLVDHESFVRWLVAYGARQAEKPVLFMAEDVYAYIVSLYQEELSQTCLYPFVPVETLDRFFNKKLMFEYAKKAGISIPRTVISPTRSELLEWDTFPSVVKPLVSRFRFEGRQLLDSGKFPRLFGSKAIRVDTREQLLEAAARVEDANIEFFVQELFVVPNRNLATVKFVSDRDGSLPSVFIGRKMRQWPADFGTVTVGESEYIAELHRASERFLKTIGFVGGGGIEYLWSDRDKEWYFIELNPRLDFWIGMAVLKGVNLPLQQYLLSTGQPLRVMEQKNGGRYWIDVIGDWEDWKWRRQHREWQVSLWDRVKPYFFFNEAIFNWRDPVPGFLRIAKALVKSLLKRLRIIGS